MPGKGRSETPLDRGAGRPGLAVVIAALPGPVCGDVGPVHAPLGAVTPGVAGAGVDEHALAAGCLADAEPLDAHVVDPAQHRAEYGTPVLHSAHGAVAGRR